MGQTMDYPEKKPLLSDAIHVKQDGLILSWICIYLGKPYLETPAAF